jgi:hypothetical protein
MEAAPPWLVLADTLLQREALISRIGQGRPPRDFAGLCITRDDFERVLLELPGLDGPGPGSVDDIHERLAPELERARKLFAEQLTNGDDQFSILVRRAGLNAVEAEALAVICAVERSPARMTLVAYAQDDVNLPRLTLATLTRMFGDARLLAPAARLHTAALVETATSVPWARRSPMPADRVLWQLHGDDSPDPRLPAGCRRIGDTSEAGRTGLFVIAGPDAATRLAEVAAAHPGRGLLTTAVPADDGAWRGLVCEATVGDRVVVLQLDKEPDPRIGDEISRAGHLTWVLASAADLPLDLLPRLPWSELRTPDPVADAEDWAAAFGTTTVPAQRLTRDQLTLAAAAAGGDPVELPRAIRRLAGGHLNGLTTRVSPRRQWSELVLPDVQTRRLREIVVRYRHRHQVYHQWGFSPVPSTGVVALFSGPSGTGKTLAAEVIAGALDLDLYRVDLSTVVSKYIGETERNLERVFSAATAGELVLFFDEADALFGKRGEVSDARDRYANIEVAYLLQRLETYDGVVVMASNLRRNIDDAFLRRIAVHLEFEPPDQDGRRRIWQLAFPPGSPVADLDLDFLAARFSVTGAVIRNAALSAAFDAADQNGIITMEGIVLALRREFDKMGRLCTEADFGRYFTLTEPVE